MVEILLSIKSNLKILKASMVTNLYFYLTVYSKSEDFLGRDLYGF